MKTLRRSILFALAAGLIACHMEPGEADYNGQEDFGFDASVADAADLEFLQGPDPLSPGEERLGLGAFYEGATTSELVVDDVSAFLFIYEDEFGGGPTFRFESTEERVEGVQADQIVVGDLGWWGMGVHFGTPRSMADWTTMHISLRSADGGFDDVQIGMRDTDTVSVLASAYGYTNDDTWHHLAIPLTDFTSQGLDITQVSAALVLVGDNASEGDSAVVDAFYFSDL
jgi:hypothetical protein